MPNRQNSPDDTFPEAFQNWSVEQLYLDLAEAKGKGLTRVEKQYLRGLLCYYSPNEIAERLHVAGDTVRNYLSKGLYRYIEELLIQQESDTIRVKDWSRVPQLLEKAGYRLLGAEEGDTSHAPVTQHSPNNSPSQTPIQEISPTPSLSHPPKLISVPDIPVFYGRQAELSTLRTWVIDDQCRLIALLGMGGIGKTTLAAQFVTHVAENFEKVVWRSLRPGLAVEQLVADLLSVLSLDGSAPESTPSLEQLIQHLVQHHCLIVLEDVQMVLQSGELAGQYEPGYEGYGDLFQRVAETPHQSCLILTGWEKPRDVALLEGEARPVRSLTVKGLGNDAHAIFQEKGLSNPELWDELVICYRGNPLALKIIATTIQELFAGSVSEFLSQSTLFLGDFTYLLTQQFSRLSSLEQEVMAWLAARGEPAPLPQLRQGIQEDIALSDLLKVLESLGRRSLLDKVKMGDEMMFTLQPMVMKYVKRHRE